jgi:hypothetical protein
MKFFKLFILSVVALFNLISLISSKKAKAKKNYPSSSSRNYRKIAPNPSFNPLPKTWNTGPLNNFGGVHNHDKYKAYTSKLVGYHTYRDTTKELEARVNQ